MSKLHHFIALENLDPRLTEKIPSNEEVLYTSKCTVMKKGYAQGKTFGQIAITNKAIAFVCKKSGISAGWASMKGNVDYIPYKDIVEFKNKKKMFYVKFSIPEDPTGKKKRGYNVWVERCKEENEDKKDFAARKVQFANFVEELINK
ncbi:MAG: PH domain-containing protein [Candidatus Hodarchaeota archaeon]